MSVGVMKDYKLTKKFTRLPHTDCFCFLCFFHGPPLKNQNLRNLPGETKGKDSQESTEAKVRK
jgi:hypothetical protein